MTRKKDVSRDRVKQWRKQKVEQGGRTLSVVIGPEAVRQFDALVAHYQEPQGRLVERAIWALYDGTPSVSCNESSVSVTNNGKSELITYNDGQGSKLASHDRR
ncbi:MAG: hypothetical protein HQK58_09445 [Deltaproteobacteria bacterium]|nr:hypothetical protein [Deltaproteobacteria bacterium]